MTFDGLGLSAEILRAVADQGYDQPTPIQLKAIPIVLDGKDLLAGAQTGTGKTAGFTLPMLQRLMQTGKERRRRIRGLVLAPTRELADQVGRSIHTYGRYLPLKSAMICGGVPFGPQLRMLRKGVDILTATPGRLLDHLRQGNVDLSGIEILVLDEADRMLDMGFIDDIKKIMGFITTKPQSLLFSATFSKPIRDLAQQLLNEPVSLEVAKSNSVADNVNQRILPVDKQRKRELLSHMITEGDWRQVLVFTRTRHGADNLAKALEKDGITSTSIHGEKSQNARNQALWKFKKGTIRALVATDVAARGLDIDRLTHVVNFELSQVPEDYVHRIGRTGRAGKEGDAISLVCEDERRLLKNIERLLKTTLDQEVIPGFEPGFSLAAPARFNSKKPNGSSGGSAYGSRKPFKSSRRDNWRDEPRSGAPKKRTSAQGESAKPQAGKSKPAAEKGRSKRRFEGEGKISLGEPFSDFDKPWRKAYKPRKRSRVVSGR